MSVKISQSLQAITTCIGLQYRVVGDIIQIFKATEETGEQWQISKFKKNVDIKKKIIAILL